MLRTIKPALFGVALGLTGMGCSSGGHAHDDRAGTRVVHAAEMGAEVKEAVAIVFGTQGNDKVKGVVRFSDTGSGVKATAEVEGLNPNQEHGFHVHEFGDASAPDAASAGGHYNPDKHEHGKPGDAKAHPGDMGNLKADGQGKAKLEVMLPGASLTGKNPILGRSVIVHAKPDDFSQPTGNAGARIGIGIIGVAQVKK
jgi:Cu-Zn family superoxide dismutase